MLACLDLPALPLQLVWRREPAWRAHPVVVIDDDRPQGGVLWACERARASGVLAGQRYAHALSLCRGLRACVVPPEQIAAAIEELRTALHAVSPRVEPGEPGTFWLDGEGLDRVFPDRPEGAARHGRRGAPRGTAWARAIARVIEAQGLEGAIVVGFSRFATYAIARGVRSGARVLPGPGEELVAAAAVPLARLELAPKLRDALARLGVTTVGQLAKLPAGGLLERFGVDAHRLHQLAAGARWDPVVPVAPPEAPDERVLFDDEEQDLERLMFALRAPLDRLLGRLAAKGRALSVLHVELTLKHAVGRTEPREESLQPAAPTLDARSLVRLVHLRLTGAPPAAPVNALRVWADDIAASREQLALFAARPRRDLRAADEALARVRAELGDDAVVCAVLRDGHLPEARFGWERLARVVPASPSPPRVPPLVRRLLARPRAMPAQSRPTRDDGWMLAGLEYGAVVRSAGPYVVSGGWWVQELHREYHFAELSRGDCLWVYYDRNRRRWFCHGGVE